MVPCLTAQSNVAIVSTKSLIFPFPHFYGLVNFLLLIEFLMKFFNLQALFLSLLFLYHFYLSLDLFSVFSFFYSSFEVTFSMFDLISCLFAKWIFIDIPALHLWNVTEQIYMKCHVILFAQHVFHIFCKPRQNVTETIVVQGSSTMESSV